MNTGFDVTNQQRRLSIILACAIGVATGVADDIPLQKNEKPRSENAGELDQADRLTKSINTFPSNSIGSQICTKDDSHHQFGTAVNWTPLAEADEAAQAAEKLVFEMHVSGNFEQEAFT